MKTKILLILQCRRFWVIVLSFISFMVGAPELVNSSELSPQETELIVTVARLVAAVIFPTGLVVSWGIRKPSEPINDGLLDDLKKIGVK